jgi:hypothetical protein
MYRLPAKPHAAPRLVLTLAFLLSAIVTLTISANPTHAAPHQSLGQPASVTRFYTTDGAVNAITQVQNTVYIGGTFTKVGPPADGIALLNSSGITDNTLPLVNGSVYAAVPDGSGGWYIGGLFSAVGTTPRNNLAHILPNRSVDTAFAPSVSGTQGVRALAMSGSTLFIGLSYNTNMAPYYGLIAINTTTNQVIPSFSTLLPQSNNPAVYTLTLYGNTLLVAGKFTINSSAGIRRNFLALDATTGSVLPMTIDVGGLDIYTLLVNGNTLYVGGLFNSVNGEPRNRLAAIDLTTSTLTNWIPPFTSLITVYAMALSGSTLYVGGVDQTASVPFLGALDTTTAALTGWTPTPVGISGVSTPAIRSLAVYNNQVIVAGEFNTMNGQAVTGVIGLDPISGAVTNWITGANNSGYVLVPDNNRLFVGGAFTTINVQPRTGVAALDATTGELLPLKVTLGPGTATVNALATANNRLYIGGNFQTVNSQPQRFVSEVDLTTGSPTGWNPGLKDGVEGVTGLAADSTHLFVVGRTGLISPARNSLFAFDLPSGTVNAWNPTWGGVPLARLTIDSGRLYIIGGAFSVNSVSYFSIAALDIATMTMVNWKTNAPGGLAAAFDPGVVYVGGNVGAGAADATTGSILWLISGSTYNALAFNPGDALYIGGSFTSLGGSAAGPNLVALDPATQAVKSWAPAPDGAVNVLYRNSTRLYVGGSFTNIDGLTHAGFAAYDLPSGSATATNTPTNTATATSTATSTPTNTPTNTATSTPVPPPPDTIGVYKSGVFYLRSANSSGEADLTAIFGGDPSDLPVAGDWNGDTVDTIGIYRSATGFFFLADSANNPAVNYTVLFGNPGDTPFAGKWTASMNSDGVGVYRNSNGILYERSSLTSGFSNYFAVFGNPGDKGGAGDWNGDGLDSIGVYRSSNAMWYLTNDSQPNGITFSQINYIWDIGANLPVVGDWDGNFTSTGGLYNPTTGLFSLNNINASPGTLNTFAFGPTGGIPIAGKWNAASKPSARGIIVGGMTSHTNVESSSAD